MSAWLHEITSKKRKIQWASGFRNKCEYGWKMAVNEQMSVPSAQPMMKLVLLLSEFNGRVWMLPSQRHNNFEEGGEETEMIIKLDSFICFTERAPMALYDFSKYIFSTKYPHQRTELDCLQTYAVRRCHSWPSFQLSANIIITQLTIWVMPYNQHEHFLGSLNVKSFCTWIHHNSIFLLYYQVHRRMFARKTGVGGKIHELFSSGDFIKDDSVFIIFVRISS